MRSQQSRQSVRQTRRFAEFAGFEWLEPRQMLAVSPVLVRDINDTVPAFDSPLTTVGDLVFFARTDEAGNELWKSDGTEAGTVRVTDLAEGPSSSSPRNFVPVNDKVYFVAQDEFGRSFLWVSDGTDSGTVQTSTHPHFNSFGIGSVAAVGQDVYFVDDRGVLYKSDGMAEGTSWVATIRGDDNQIEYPSELLSLRGQLYFFTGSGLWTSDGTQEGTVQVAIASYPREGVVSNGHLYFSASTSDTGRELWVSDGTTEGTYLLKDLSPGPASARPHNFTDINGTVYFTGGQNQLWKTDGTADGTVVIKEIGVDTCFREFCDYYRTSSLTNLARVEETLFFTTDDGFSGKEVWKSDGTPEGTVELKDIGPGRFGSNPRSLVALEDRLFFVADDPYDRVELWSSNGTEEGTVQVKDISPGRQSSQPRSLVSTGGRLFFTATDGVSERTLWTSDGSQEGTHAVTHFTTPTLGSFPSNLQFVDDVLWFNAADGVWSSDGTREGTIDRIEGAGVNHVFFFQGASLFATENALWRSDSADEDPVKIWEGERPQEIVRWGDSVYFYTSMGLWKSDATSEGTVILSEIDGIQSVDFSDSRFFIFSENSAAKEIWTSDGTVNGTTSLLTVEKKENSYPRLQIATVAGDTAMIIVEKPDEFTSSIYSASESAQRLLEFTGSRSSAFDFRNVEMVNDRFVFRVVEINTRNGREEHFLYSTDGTVEGTISISEAAELDLTSPSGAFFPLGSSVAFAIQKSGAHELWQTDGTVDGTKMILELPRPRDSYSHWETLGEAGGSTLLTFWEETFDEITFRIRATVYAIDADSDDVETLLNIGPLRETDVAVGSVAELGDQMVIWVALDNFFSGSHVERLYTTDGSAAGTNPLTRDHVNNSTVIGDQLFVVSGNYSQQTGEFVGYLNVKDGTSDELQRLIEVREPHYLGQWGDLAVLVEREGVWTSDGTVEGTQLLATIPDHWNYLSNITPAGDTLYFTTDDGIYGHELWKIERPITGDFDGNGRVDQNDLDLVLLNWGAPATTLPDGWVGDPPTSSIAQDELDAVLLNWGTGSFDELSFEVPEALPLVENARSHHAISVKKTVNNEIDKAVARRIVNSPNPLCFSK